MKLIKGLYSTELANSWIYYIDSNTIVARHIYRNIIQGDYINSTLYIDHYLPIAKPLTEYPDILSKVEIIYGINNSI